MARSSTVFSPPPPPLPKNFRGKKKDVNDDELFQAGAGSKRSKSKTQKNLADPPLCSDSKNATAAAKLKATADLKAAEIEIAEEAKALRKAKAYAEFKAKADLKAVRAASESKKAADKN